MQHQGRWVGSRSLRSDLNEICPSSVIIKSLLATYSTDIFVVVFWGCFLFSYFFILHLPFRREKNNLKTIP